MAVELGGGGDTGKPCRLEIRRHDAVVARHGRRAWRVPRSQRPPAPEEAPLPPTAGSHDPRFLVLQTTNVLRMTGSGLSNEVIHTTDPDRP